VRKRVRKEKKGDCCLLWFLSCVIIGTKPDRKQASGAYLINQSRVSRSLGGGVPSFFLALGSFLV
jgi:hypothetical protein